jgi:peptide/nickel transport system substrate-binding protein
MSRTLALVTALLLVLGACAPAPTTSTTTPSPGAPGASPTAAATPRQVASMRIAILADEGTLTPFSYKFGYPGQQMMYLTYDTLMVLDQDNIPRPLLAKDVKSSADGTTYDLTLRSGVKWHDGKPLTNADVKFSFDFILAGTRAAFRTPIRTVTSITLTGTEGLSIKLSAPNPSFPVRALAAVPIIPKHIWEGVEPAKQGEFKATVGSGPYKLTEATPDTVYRMQANPEYFLGAPPVNELIWPVIKDQNTAFQALRTGEVHAIIREVPPEQVSQFSNAPFKIAKGPGFASTMLQFNNTRAPWNRKEVRQAVDFAIDKKKLVDTLLLGNATVATPGFIHPSSPFHDAGVTARYDVARAKALLDGIGARPGADGIRVLDGKPMTATLLSYSNNPIRLRAAELIQGMLKDIGIGITIRTLDTNALDALVWPEFDVSKGRDYDLSMWGWSAPVQVDAARVLEFVHSDTKIGTGNIGGYKNAQADDLGNQIAVTADEAKRKSLIQQLERLIADEVPFSMLYFQDGVYAYRAETYDGWVFQKGLGIITKLSFIPALR